jgi:DCN1-like protein 1/2
MWIYLLASIGGFANQNNSCESLAKQKAYIAAQIKALSTDMALFKRVYRYVFVCAKEKGQKALPLDTAIEYWRVLFAPPGKTWVTSTTDWTTLWFEFLAAKWTKSVNRDMWHMTLDFLQKAVKDESLSFWSEDGAWPSVIDEFVVYAKEKKGISEMETD